MKNVYTSWDLDLLADKMIEKIMENWKSPFSSPAVVTVGIFKPMP